MANVPDVGTYVSQTLGPMASRKLQKVVYYCQAWSLVWDGRPLFRERVEAWRGGPLVSRLYWAHHKEWFVDELSAGNVSASSERERATIDAVLAFYGAMPWDDLVKRTHLESPWADARAGLIPSQSSRKEITPRSMRVYYTRESMLGEKTVPLRPAQPTVTAPDDVVAKVNAEQAAVWEKTLAALADR